MTVITRDTFGMAMKATALGEMGVIISNITLFAVLIYELVGPLLTKIALTKAGEISSEGRISAREEAWHILSKLHLDHRHERHASHIERHEDKKINKK